MQENTKNALSNTEDINNQDTIIVSENNDDCKTNKKESFILFNEQMEVFEALTNEQAGELLKAIFKYETKGILPNFDGMLKIAFIPIKQQLDRNEIKYNEFREKQRQNGLKGGRPKKADTILENPKNPSLFLKTQKSLNDNVNDNDIKEKIYKKEKFKPPTLEEIKEYCLNRKNDVNPEKFFEYYQESDWKDKNNKPVKNWKQKVITWENYSTNTRVQKQQIECEVLQNEFAIY